MKNTLWGFMALAILTLSTSEAISQDTQKPKNIILLIGDGMGLSAVSTGFFYGEGTSQFYRFKNIGLQKTNSATHKVTDSAASGTAMATGTKTYNGAIGVDPAKIPVESITEIVSDKGWSTGVVATSTISHATPASFYAHVEQRSNEPEIAAQLITSEIDFFAGGGAGHFTRREDGRNLLEDASEAGFQIDTSNLKSARMLHPKEKYGFLLNAGAMPNAAVRGDFLPQASLTAIEYLSNNKKGFFLMVEGSQIDWAGHANDTEFLIGEQMDFEEVIKVAMDFAEKDKNTLVVVTADHETGGFTLSAKKNEETGKDDYVEIGPRFATGSHSATLIPVFAYGPGAEAFEGIYENTEIFEKMKALAVGK